MDYKGILKLGLKILVAAAAGVAVFAGIDGRLGGMKKKSNDSNSTAEEDNEQQPGRRQQRRDWRRDDEEEYVSLEGDWKKEASRPTKDGGAIQSLKNIQGTLGKLLTLAQSITLFAQSLKRVFSGSGDDGDFYYSSGFYDPLRQPVFAQGGVVFNRLSPFVTEVEFDNRYYRGRY